MPRTVPIAAVLILLCVPLGCGANSSPSPSASGESKPAAKPSPEPPSQPASNPHALDPHARTPPSATPPGPPRDVTPSGETMTVTVDGLAMVVPSEWTHAPGSNPMRKAEFIIPGPGGDVRLVVSRFAGGAGLTAKNIERWKGQITLAEGAEAQTSEREVNGLKVTSVDMRGRYAGQSMPGAPPQPPVDDARMLAAAIEGAGDPWYFKLVGPAATIDVWGSGWTKLLAELAPAASSADGDPAEGASTAEPAPSPSE
ncbi:hypothetical protein [Enhygromyxa salina]|nr:hypothetical protein [Enhygromyxa salina]